MSLQLIPIGHTQKTYGVDGTLRIVIEDQFFEDFVAAEVVFLEMGGRPTPFFIEDRWGNGDLFLKLEEVDDKEAARPLTNKPLSLRSEDVQGLTAPTAEAPGGSYRKWLGYTIYDQHLGRIGIIAEIAELPQQFLAVIREKDQEIMIPLHEDLILEVKPKEKQLLMDLPEGLLEL